MSKQQFYFRRIFASLFVSLAVISAALAQDVSPSKVKEGISITVVNDSALYAQGHRPKIGLVLSGGGAKGSAHIGVLKVIEEVGIPIDYVAGTSMGSIIGGLYALGYSPDEMDELISGMDWPKYMSDRTPFERLSYQEKLRKTKYALGIPWDFGKTDSLSLVQSLPGGVVSGNHLENLFNSLALGYQGNIDFNDLPIPFACVATDLVSGKEVVFRKGNLPLAIRSSMSIPGLFSPVWIDDMVLVDGGILNNIPIDVCREMGADIVISVMVGTPVKGDPQKLHSMLGILGRLLGVVNGSKSSENISHSDLTITPDLSGNGILSFEKESIKQLIANGYAAGALQRDSLVALKNKLAKWGDEATPHLYAPKAKNAITDTLLIRSVTMKGVNKSEIAWLMWKSDLDDAAGKYFTGEQLDSQLAILHGTNAFSKVSYSIVRAADSDKEEYDVIVDFKKKPANTFAIALRFDNLDASSFNLKLGLNSYRIVGPKLELMAKLGYNPSITLLGSYGWKKWPKLNLSYNFRKTEFSWSTYGYDYAKIRLLKHNVRFYASGLYSRHWGLQGGLEFEQFLSAKLYTDASQPLPLNLEPTTKTDNPYLGLFAEFSIDTRNDWVLPSRGIDMKLSGSWKFLNMRDNTDFKKFGDVMLHFNSYIPLGKRWVLSPQVYSRYFAGDNTYDIIVNEERMPNSYCVGYLNYLGGVAPGKFMDQQLPFIGVNKPEIMGNFLAVGMAELRYNFYGIHHVSLVGSFMRHSKSLGTMFQKAGYEFYEIKNEEFAQQFGLEPDTEGKYYFPWLTAENAWGAGVRYTAKLPTGPAMVQVAYSSLTKSASIYFSMGLNF